MGVSNRTLPQNITPIPSLTAASQSLQCTVTAATTTATPCLAVSQSAPVPAKQTCAVDENAVRVSHQNPYLNIRIGDKIPPSSGAIVQPEVLKAMDECLNNTLNARISVNNATAPAKNSVCVGQTLKTGSSGDFMQRNNSIVADSSSKSRHDKGHPSVESPKISTSSQKQINTAANNGTSSACSVVSTVTVCKDAVNVTRRNSSESSILLSNPLLTEMIAKNTPDNAPFFKINEKQQSDESGHSIGLLEQAKMAHDSDRTERVETARDSDRKSSKCSSPSSQSSQECRAVQLWWKSNNADTKKKGKKCARFAKPCKRADTDDFVPYECVASTPQPGGMTTRRTNSGHAVRSAREIGHAEESAKRLQVVLRDINNSDSESKTAAVRRGDAEETRRKKDELFVDSSRSSDDYSVNSSPGVEREKSAQTRKKNLREFAASAGRRARGAESSDRASASWDGSGSPGVRSASSRGRSQSADAGLETACDENRRRYPRRNLCLKSFSGLSPDYAIRSYSPETRGRTLERFETRSGKKYHVGEGVRKLALKRKAATRESAAERARRVSRGVDKEHSGLISKRAVLSRMARGVMEKPARSDTLVTDNRRVTKPVGTGRRGLKRSQTADAVGAGYRSEEVLRKLSKCYSCRVAVADAAVDEIESDDSKRAAIRTDARPVREFNCSRLAADSAASESETGRLP